MKVDMLLIVLVFIFICFNTPVATLKAGNYVTFREFVQTDPKPVQYTSFQVF